MSATTDTCSVDMPTVHLTVVETSKATMLSRCLRCAFDDAMAGVGKLDKAAFDVPGMSGWKFRLFLNNLIGSVDDARYLEIGVFMGGTLCSAVWNNRVSATAIDNWSEYGPCGVDFLRNLAKFRGPESKLSFLERDFRKVDYAAIGKFNVCFFDGPHEERDQYDGALLPQPSWDDSCILIVDDWNWDKVRSGTLRAFRDSNVRVDYSIDLRTTLNGEMPLVQTTASEWHNGVFMAVVSKSSRPNGTF